MKRNRPMALALVLLVVSAVCYLPILQMPLNVYDEGIVLAGADRVLWGDVPYRDFWSMYPPGQFYVLALLFKLFGTSATVARVYDLFVRALLAVCTFLTAKKLGGSTAVALAGWVVALVWIGFTRFAAYPVYAALVLIGVGLLLYLHHLETGQGRWLFYSGLALALGAVFRHDLAGMAAFVVLLALLARRLLERKGGWRPIGVYLGGLAAVGLPIAVYFIAVVGIRGRRQGLFFPFGRKPADIIQEPLVSVCRFVVTHHCSLF